jgi:beta-galactosidase/beta-glucuronidase
MRPYKTHFIFSILFVGAIFPSIHLHAHDKTSGAPFKRNINFNDGWKFKRCASAENALETFKEIDYDDKAWETVALPHTPRIEPLVVNDQWQGICWYRKEFVMEQADRGKKIFIEFEAAMQIAEIWINAKHKTNHYGGYLPFTIDITDDVFLTNKICLLSAWTIAIILKCLPESR